MGALALWLISLSVISVRVAINPIKRTVTPVYHQASRDWADRKTLYEGTSGMHYLPPFVALYAPFEWLPLRLSEVVWRWLGTGMIAGGLWRICRSCSQSEERLDRNFFLVTALSFPLCLPAINNGQANATMAGLFLLATACCLERRTWLAALCLGLAVAVKPLGVAAVGLAVAVFPSLLVPSLVATVAVLLLPYATAPAPYVTSQYQAAWANLRECAVISENRFADLNGIIRAFGTELNGTPGLALRAVAGLTMFVLCAVWVRRQAEPGRSLAWYGFSALYLMLFNPMTEANSYVILAPGFALASVLTWNRGLHSTAWFWGGAVLSMGLLPNIVRPWFGNNFALVWHPVLALLLLGWLVAVVLRTALLVGSDGHSESLKLGNGNAIRGGTTGG